MIKDVIEFSANSIWPQIGLIVFMVCFIGVVAWTVTGKKKRFEHESMLPLEEGATENAETLKR